MSPYLLLLGATALRVLGPPAPVITSLSTKSFRIDATKRDSTVLPNELSKVARCVVQTDGLTWMTLFHRAPATGRTGAEAVKSCVYKLLPGREFQVNSMTLKGSIAEEFYLEKFSSPVTLNADPLYHPPFEDRVERILRVEEAADCILRKQPAEVARLLHLPGGSKAESDLLINLSASNSECLDGDEVETLSPMTMRAMLASVLLRRSLPADASASDQSSSGN